MSLSSCEEFIQEYKKGESNIEYPILDDKDFIKCAKKLVTIGLVDSRDIVYHFNKKAFIISGNVND